MADEEAEYKITLKDVHREVTTRLDSLHGTLQGLALTVTTDLTDLKRRVGHLEDAEDRRAEQEERERDRIWNRRGVVIGSYAALAAAVLGAVVAYLLTH